MPNPIKKAFFILLLLFCTELIARFLTNQFKIFDIEMLKYSLYLKDYTHGPQKSFVHRPNSILKLMGVRVSTNSNGWRDDEYEDDKPPQIAFLGDSMTFGWGVSKKDIFEDILDKKLLNKLNIANMGHCNFNTVQEVDYYLNHRQTHPENIIYLFYFLNDAEETVVSNKIPIKFYSRFFALLDSVKVKILNRIDYKDYYRALYSKDKIGWLSAQAKILHLNTWALKNGKHLRVIIIPDFHQMNPYPFLDIHQKILSFFKDSHIAHYDLLGAFEGKKEMRSYWVSFDDPHPNVEAHRIIANTLWPILEADLRKINFE